MGRPIAANEVTVISEDHAAESVASLGLDLDLIVQALRDGEVGSREAYSDRSFPPTAPGYFRWAHTVASLRRAHVKDGEWELHNDHNRPLLKSPAGELTVTACGGTADVGDPEGKPNVANRKGRATERAYDQLELISLSQVLRIRIAEDSVPVDGHWMLLYYRSKDELRVELSLPKGIENGLVSGWHTRIMLPSLLFDEELEELPGRDGENDVDFYLEEA
ncbi:hypothetical protein [Corynebacterium cystitidis]|uniref:Uncharacterized protein n=1 Tax=Corynebacterium cystitidis DSM 20524 TaxID=1121357 RepID=A0A1H9UWX6_9CORY|nr:hypothetical protein [Corynebacterium cystitidis]WJY83665.1 hypothetical protein CCYS_13920 [Corynebacterium cystitidis DSM 20524]SES13922.1 hypothetical protein SAMN05661109_01971 [Corynebacterium cystitidis DSM 20524]SNV91441.1 Uncharacterised protein [Corynebacterium cystitidis]